MCVSDREAREPRITKQGERVMPRRRWFRVRLQTDECAYLGSLRLESGRPALDKLIADGRAYLALWDATEEGSAKAREFVAIHKSAIRSVVLLGGTLAPEG